MRTSHTLELDTTFSFEANIIMTPRAKKAFWKETFKLHFPHRLREIIILARRRDEEIDWYKAFWKIYSEEYQHLSNSDRLIFSLAKKGDLDSFRNRVSNFSMLNRFIQIKVNNLTIFHWAKHNNHQHLLDYCYSLAETIHPNVRQRLRCAIIFNQPTQTILPLIKQIERINASDSDHFTPIQIAAKFGHEAAMDLLIENNAFVDLDLLIKLAASHGQVDITKSLLKQGAKELIALRAAVLHGHVKILALFKKISIFNTIVTNAGDSLLDLAASNNHIGAILFLIRNGASVNSVNPLSHYTALHHAALNGHIDAIRLLIEKGAVVNVSNANGDTPLHLAAFNGHVDAMELLITNNADLNATNHNGDTPLFITTSKLSMQHISATALLVNYGAHIRTDGYVFIPLFKVMMKSDDVNARNIVLQKALGKLSSALNEEATRLQNAKPVKLNLFKPNQSQNQVIIQMATSAQNVYCGILENNCSDDSLKQVEAFLAEFREFKLPIGLQLFYDEFKNHYALYRNSQPLDDTTKDNTAETVKVGSYLCKRT